MRAPARTGVPFGARLPPSRTPPSARHSTARHLAPPNSLATTLSRRPAGPPSGTDRSSSSTALIPRPRARIRRPGMRLPLRKTLERCGCCGSSKEHFGHREERVVDRLELRGRLRERDARDLGAAQRRHLSPFLFRDHVGGVDAEARAEHAVECRGRTPALDVPKNGGAGFVAGPLLDQLGDLLPDAELIEKRTGYET